MGWRRPLLLSAFALAAAQLHGCAAGTDAAERAGRSAGLAVQPWEIDPYTHTEQIIVDGNAVGYLVTYDALPAGMEIERIFPAGGRRILAARFEDVGYVTPRGLFGRHGARGAVEELGYHELNSGLIQFFGGAAQAKLVAFGGDAPKKLAPAAAGDGEAATDGEAAAEDGSEAIDEG